MTPILKPDSNGIFSSPWGHIEPEEIKWKTMKDFLTHVFLEKHPDKYIVEPQTERKITYERLFRAAEKLADSLREEGIGRKTIIHIVGENRLKWLGVLLAAHVNGYVVSCSHPISPWPEIQRNIQTTCATALVLTETCYQKYTGEIRSPFLTHVIALDDLNDGHLYNLTFKVTPNEQSQQPEYNHKELDGVCELLLSSGTTGVPKAVKLSDIDVISSCIINIENGAMTIDDSTIMPVIQPLAHLGGQNLSFLNPAFAGANFLILDYPGSIGFLEVIQKYAVTHVFAVPPVLNFMAKYEHLEKYDLSSLRCIFTGATTVNFDSIRTIRKRSGNDHFKAKNLYGATETLGAIFMTNDFYETTFESIGIPFRGISYKICSLDDENKVITEAKQEGELVVKFDLGLSLYFNDVTKTNESLTRDGFYKTGDVVYLDGNNNVFITGRIKDVVKFRGFSVSPAEIENILLGNTLVADCTVVGRNSEEHGEVPVAFVLPSTEGSKTEDEVLKSTLIKFVADNIADHKKIHEVYLIDKIPRSGSGKILKRELRKLIE